VLAAAMGVLAAMTIVGAHAVLTLWLGNAFADAGAMPLRILAVGVLANALAQVPFAILQGSGRADVTATIHLIELPLYGAALWLLTERYGITGAALAWSGRMALDLTFLHFAARRPLGAPVPLLRPLIMGGILPIGGATALAMSHLSGLAALGATAAAGIVTAAMSWQLVLSGEERQAALRLAFRKTNFADSMQTPGSPLP
jgi:O-antigen/teichoic acid export membrane protein